MIAKPDSNPKNKTSVKALLSVHSSFVLLTTVESAILIWSATKSAHVHTESMSVQCTMDLRLDDAQGKYSMNTL